MIAPSGVFLSESIAVGVINQRENTMAVSKRRQRAIRKACQHSAAGRFNQASIGTGKVSIAKPSARAKGSGTAWSEAYPRPR